ncbi:hypothetical protein VB264_18685 [Arcicella aquatica]|uniref:TonB C-terminal domain-containing protein n=1 Tax=Arcicella aquatica TaxID=217141 RepID=A0ABU5QRX7_9BACT|nr:hypothetical protein [Arcicella aquatica]MEA5259831.1 hypothetical protein [Arcicella aquatica]
MKILSAPFKVVSLVLLFTHSIFSQQQDTLRIIDVKSFMEPFFNRNSDTIVYMATEHPAVFPGGKDSLNAFVKRHLIKVSIPFSKNNGMVLCWVIIEKNGCVSEVEIITRYSHNSALEDGIKNALYSSPMWTSATQDGKKVRYKTIFTFNIP